MTHTDRFPASWIQRQFWILHQLDPFSPAYNVGSCFRLEGEPDIGALERSVRELLKRHAILRAVFVDNTLGDLEVACAPLPPGAMIDSVNLDEPDRRQELPDAVIAELRAPFDLRRGPLVRVRLFCGWGQTRFLTITMHHIVCDLHTKDIIAAELGRFYGEAVEGRRTEQEPGPSPYAEFARRQERWVEGEECRRMLEYWKNETAGVGPLDLPIDKPRPAFQSLRGDAVPVAFDPAQARQIREAATRLNINSFLLLLSSYAVLLHRYSGTGRICIGVPLTNRRNPAFADTVGCFVSILPLVAECSDHPPAAELIRRLRLKMLGAHRNQEVPFALIARSNGGARDSSRNPVFQAGFTFEHPMHLDLRGVQLGEVPFHHGGAQLDLFASFWEEGETIRGFLEYASELLEAATVEAMAAHLKQVALEIAADPSVSIGRIALMDRKQVRTIVSDWNCTAMELPRVAGVHELVLERARQSPGAAALCFNGACMSYGELVHAAKVAAGLVVKAGGRPGERIGLCLERSERMVVSILGIWMAGCAYVPLDPDFPGERLDYALNDSRARIVVTEGSLRARFTERNRGLVLVDSGLCEQVASGEPAEGGTAEAPAYVMYTSGSTGKPKGVAVPHRALVNFLLSMVRTPGLSGADTMVAVTTMAFDISLLELFGPLVAGGRVVVASRDMVVDGERLGRLLAREEATIMQATPTTWRLLVESGWSGRPGFRALVGGEPLPQPLMAALVSRCAELWNMYGPTETTVWSTCHRCRAGESRVRIGRPIANTAVYILDAALQPTPPGVWGELHIGGLGVASGYLNRPDLTAERFVADPFGAAPGGVMYRTGDLCRFRHDGTIEYGRRTDNQVKVRGFRIELGDIDSALLRHAAVTSAATITAVDPGGDTVLVSYLTGPAAAVEELREFLRGIVPAYMVPSHIVALESLPLTPNGKTDRSALPLPWSFAAPAPPQPVVERVSDIEQSLLSIWREVLGMDSFGTGDNFFDVGGTSIKVLQVKTLVAERLGAEVAAAELFQFPTVASFAAHIGRHGRTQIGETEQVAERMALRHQALAHRRAAARRARVMG